MFGACQKKSGSLAGCVRAKNNAMKTYHNSLCTRLGREPTSVRQDELAVSTPLVIPASGSNRREVLFLPLRLHSSAIDLQITPSVPRVLCPSSLSLAPPTALLGQAAHRRGSVPGQSSASYPYMPGTGQEVHDLGSSAPESAFRLMSAASCPTGTQHQGHLPIMPPPFPLMKGVAPYCLCIK